MWWWQAPVISATWEAEAGEWLEPGRDYSEQRSRHYTWATRAKLFLKKNKNSFITCIHPFLMLLILMLINFFFTSYIASKKVRMILSFHIQRA